MLETIVSFVDGRFVAMLLLSSILWLLKDIIGKRFSAGGIFFIIGVYFYGGVGPFLSMISGVASGVCIGDQMKDFIRRWTRKAHTEVFD